MAVVRARSSPPVALIATVIVAVAATALAVLFYLNGAKAAQDAADANAKLSKLASTNDLREIVPGFAPGPNDRSSAVAVAQKQINDLKMLISGDTKSSIESLKADADSLKPLLTTVKSLKADRDAKADALAKLESQSTVLNADIAASNKQASDALAMREKTVDDLRAQLAKANAALTTANTALDAASTKAQDELNKFAAAQEELRRNLVLQVDQLNNEAGDKDRQIAELRRRIEGSMKNADVNVGEPDGKIVRVSAAAGEVYIDLGAKDRMTPGLSFTAFDPRTGVRFGTDEAAQGNGSIEVIQVGEKSSLCRITHVTKDRTIQAGDLIANLVYHSDKNRSFRFVVFGDFDLDGDGVATAAERERLVAMIRTWGGVVDNDISPQTDYLVLGTRPSSPVVMDDQAAPAATAPGSALDQRSKLQDQYDGLAAKARSLSIPTLNANRFLAMIGYYNTTVVRN